MADGEIDTRLLQVFLSYQSDYPGPSIFEVSSDQYKNLLCNCPGFKVKKSCKHVALVESRISKNNGVYQFDFSERVTAAELREAMKSQETFRALVIKFGKIEVY